jgi:hypothetical protein
LLSDSFKKRVTCLNFYGGKKAFWKKNQTAKEKKAKLCSTSLDNTEDQKTGQIKSKAKAVETN